MSGAPGPGGRGAALLEALKAKNCRPGEETPAAHPPAGRAAMLTTLKIKSAAESKTPVGAAAAAEPPLAPVQPKGRTALLAKLKAAATSAPGQPVTQAAPSHLSPPGGSNDKSPPGSRVFPTGARPKTPSSTQVSPERSSPAGQAAAELDKMQIKSPVIRKGEGGKKVSLTANYVRLEVEKGKGVFEYEVRFSPPVDSKNERFKCLNQHRNMIGLNKVFDGVVLFIPFQLPDHKTQLQSEQPNDGSPVTVTITLKHHKGIGDRDCIQLYNVLFNRIMNSLKMCMMNRNFYDPRNGHMIPQHRLEVWPGYVTAVQEFEDGIMLNCDVSHRVVHTQTVRDHLVDIHKMGKDNFKANAEKALIGSIVITRYNNRCYKVDDIDFDATPSSTFTDYTGKETSFVEYYKRQYNIDIKDLKQPMLLHREKKKAQEEQGVTKLICLVPELTFMTGLTDSMKADFRVMEDVAMYSRVTPNQRQLSLKKLIQNINSSEEASAHLKGWGLKLSPTPIKLEGRVLEPETLHLGKGFKNMMVVGVDVYHDPSRKTNSIAGVVCSLNHTFSGWHSSTCFQLPGQELVDALKIAFIKGLKKYYETNHSWPDTVIIFRDGVGDGQLDVTSKHEVLQFKDCFKQISDDYSPGLGFVVVQKRINTRIFLQQSKDCENPAPGTVLDHTVTKRDWYDFFLVSQHVGQGTVSPSHYIVLHDSSGLSPGDMQKLAYKLTHMYYNWPVARNCQGSGPLPVRAQVGL